MIFTTLHGPPSDESFPTIYAPSWRCITYRKSSATTTDPIRSLFVYYVWFTVVYQGKSLVAREGAEHLSPLSPSPFPSGTYDRWLSMTYRWWDPQRERGWHADSHPRCRYRAFRGKITPLHCARFSLRDELPGDIPRSYLRRYRRLLRLLRRYGSTVLMGDALR